MKQDHILLITRKYLLNNAALSHCHLEEDRLYVSKYKNPERQQLTLAMRNLTRHYLANFTNSETEDWNIKVNQNEHRFAITVTGEIYNLSFTHSPNWVGVAIGAKPVGIDIEEDKVGRPWRDMISFLNLPIPEPNIQSESAFLKYWTAYEAQFKFASGALNQKAQFLHTYHINPNTSLCLASNNPHYTLKKWHPTL